MTRALTRTYPATDFGQRDSATFLEGAAVAANDTITIQVVSSRAIVYGATIDRAHLANRTNDPSMQLARRGPESPARVK